MTTDRVLDDSDGTFGVWIPDAQPCRICGGPVEHRLWESHDGGYEDYQYRCRGTCKRIWWIDGIDA